HARRSHADRRPPRRRAGRAARGSRARGARTRARLRRSDSDAPRALSPLLPLARAVGAGLLAPRAPRSALPRRPGATEVAALRFVARGARLRAPLPPPRPAAAFLRRERLARGIPMADSTPRRVLLWALLVPIAYAPTVVIGVRPGPGALVTIALAAAV